MKLQRIILCAVALLIALTPIACAVVDTQNVIDGILSQEKKEVDKVIINSAELEKYFGKDKSPREMKDKIISLLDEWKAKQPPELGKPEKKTDREK